MRSIQEKNVSARIMRAQMLVFLFLGASLAGCLGSTGSGSGSEDTSDLSQPANWSVGQWWLYTFSTPEWEDDSARLVVTETDAEEGTAYMLGITSQREARRHAVLNHNPFLGRITHDNLSAYENGAPQSVLQFPLVKGASWSFTLFAQEWTTIVTNAMDGVATLEASTTDGQSLDYVYSGSMGFFSDLVWTSSENQVLLQMTAVTTGLDYKGNVWFVQAGDIFSKEWDNNGGPDAEIEDSFFVSGHPSAGDYDEMIYWLDAAMGTGSTGSLTLRDHFSTSALTRQWGSGAEENGNLGTIPYPSGEYTLTITQTGDSYIRFFVAGGITTTWTL